MRATTFKGDRELVERLDQAVRESSIEGTTAAVQKTLEELIGNGQLCLPDALREASEHNYARRLLYQSEDSIEGFLTTSVEQHRLTRRRDIEHGLPAFGVQDVDIESVPGL